MKINNVEKAIEGRGDGSTKKELMKLKRPYEPYGVRTEYGFKQIPRSKRKRF